MQALEINSGIWGPEIDCEPLTQSQIIPLSPPPPPLPPSSCRRPAPPELYATARERLETSPPMPPPAPRQMAQTAEVPTPFWPTTSKHRYPAANTLRAAASRWLSTTLSVLAVALAATRGALEPLGKRLPRIVDISRVGCRRAARSCASALLVASVWLLGVVEEATGRARSYLTRRLEDIEAPSK